MRAKWGVMCHYLDSPASSHVASPTSPDEWNRRVESFDVAGFARQIQDLGADYLIFTLGQNSGHFCAPNAVYDELVGVAASRLSRRDLIAEIADALAPATKVIAYLPSHAPAKHREAVLGLRCTPPWDAGAWGLEKFWPDELDADARLSEFERHWEAIVRYWGETWGDKICGWWIDGCYFAETMYNHVEAPNFASLAAALRAGYSERIVAFNSGTAHPFARLAAEQDYTAGEFSNRLPFADKWTPLESTTDGMQTHLLGFLGRYWGEGEPRFPDELVRGYTRALTARGVALTWDIPISAEGKLSPLFARQLRGLSQKKK